MAIDKQALRKKYAAERAKRVRADGNEQYLRLTGDLAGFLHDPYTPVVDRPPRTEGVTVAFIGGGFAGLVTAARLKEAGVDDVCIIEKAGGFGGTWYWNRYPGAQCDTASLVYMPLLEETGQMPSEKYAHGPEILEHCERIGKHYGLYSSALFHTEVTDLSWDDTTSRWIVRTNRGDAFPAQFVALGTGPLHVPKLPGISRDHHKALDRTAARTMSRWCRYYTLDLPSAASGQEDCARKPIYAPGARGDGRGGMSEATVHRQNAIVYHQPAWISQMFMSKAEKLLSGVSYNWKSNAPYFCEGRAADKTACDEFPNYSSVAGGPGASLRVLDSIDNSAEGGLYLGFAGQYGCKLRSATAAVKNDGDDFLVIPMTGDGAPPTLWVCGR